MAEILQFPKTVSAILNELDEDRILKGNVTVNERKYRAFINSLEKVNQYGENRGVPVKILADDPRVYYTSHTLLIHFETNEFEDEQVKTFAEIVKDFDTMTFLQSETGEISVLLVMEDVWKET